MSQDPSGSPLSETATFPEQRAVPRYSFAAVAELTDTATETWIRGRISEISSKGCYIRSLTALPVGTVLDLYISGDCGTFSTRGKILYSHEQMGMGVLFIDPPKDQSRVLDCWLAELSSESV